MNSQERARAVARYVCFRLLDEEAAAGKPFGWRSKVAKAAEISSAHVTNIMKSKAAAAQDAAEKLATGWWKTTFRALEDEAIAWWNGGGSAWRPPTSDAPSATPEPDGASLAPATQTYFTADPGQARTNDPLFWADFAKRAGNEAFDDIAEATRARAVREAWPDGQLDAVLNIAAKAVGRNFDGRPPTHAEARAGVARGVAVVIEGRDPEDAPASKAHEPTMVAVAVESEKPQPSPAERLAAIEAKEKADRAAKRHGASADATARPHEGKRLGAAAKKGKGGRP